MSNQERHMKAVERDKQYAPFLWEHRLKGTGWLAEQLGMPAWEIRKKMIRLKIPRKPKTGANLDRNNFWKGGRIVDKDGYVLKKVNEHPLKNNAGYVREHRLVMEQYLERYLSREEVVHHKNGIRSDNRIENLELFSSNGDHMALEWSGRRHSEETKQKMSQSALHLWEKRRKQNQ